MNEHTSTQLQLVNGAYWHIARPFDVMWELVADTTWLQLPLVIGSHDSFGPTVAINVAHIASMRPLPVEES